jgi:hypothetical protein
MRPRSLALLCAPALFLALPAFAQMTQQNKSNQGHAANPPTPATRRGEPGQQCGAGGQFRQRVAHARCGQPE